MVVSFFCFFVQISIKMIAAPGLHITRVERSKLTDINLENLPFGKYFTDHMLEVDYENGEWRNSGNQAISAIVNGTITGGPALRAIHI